MIYYHSQLSLSNGDAANHANFILSPQNLGSSGFCLFVFYRDTGLDPPV